jgi:hypothetical protein
MFWNIALALLVAAVTGVIAGLGGHLASTKAWHKWTFWGGGLIVWILLGVQTYRNELAQRGLQSQLDTIQRNTERPQVPPIINVPPPIVNFPPQEAYMANIDRGLIQFRVGSQIEMNFASSNLSLQAVAFDEHNFAAMYIAEANSSGDDYMVSPKEQDKYYRQFMKEIAQSHSDNEGRAFGPGEKAFNTTSGPILDADMENQIKSGPKAILHFIRYVWRDGGGHHVNEVCQWLQSTSFQPGNRQIWHSCDHHNGPPKRRPS